MTLLQAAEKVIDKLRKVTLCARCHGDGFTLYFDSDGYGADRYDCSCLEVKKALEEYDALRKPSESQKE